VPETVELSVEGVLLLPKPAHLVLRVENEVALP
jgi:hypothetical protein